MTQRHVWTLHDVPCVAGCGADDITCAGCGLCQECVPGAVDGLGKVCERTEGAKELAERHLRAWIEQGDINADASL